MKPATQAWLIALASTAVRCRRQIRHLAFIPVTRPHRALALRNDDGKDIMQHGAIQRQVGHQPPELLLSSSGCLPHRISGTPSFGSPLHRRSILCLPHGKGDRLARKAFERHGIHPPQGSGCPKNLRSAWSGLMGEDHRVDCARI
nr:hypothetical protein [Methylobacterium sp. E-045]